jgi:hypothetical protein
VYSTSPVKAMGKNGNPATKAVTHPPTVAGYIPPHNQTALLETPKKRSDAKGTRNKLADQDGR